MSSRAKLIACLILWTICQRLLPYLVTNYDVRQNPSVIFYPWSFMPLTAVCIYMGAYVKNLRSAIGLALLTTFLSDFSFWIVTGNFSHAFPTDRWSAYIAYPLIVIMGIGLNRQSYPLRGFSALGRGMLAEVLFFLLSNFAYFLVQSDLPHDASGLTTCYINAIPFANWAFYSTAFYSLLLFSPLAAPAADESPDVVKPTMEAVPTH